MMPVLLPILAQTVSVGVSERTEGRYVIQPEDRSFQAETRASAGMSVIGRNTGMSLAYSAGLYSAPFTIPVDNLTILQDASISAYIGFEFKRSSLTLSQSVAYNQVNYALVALSARPVTLAPLPEPQPDPGAGAPGGPDTPTPEPIPGSEAPRAQTLHYLTATSNASLSHELSRRMTLGEYLSYSYHRALGDRTEREYPTSHGLSSGVSLTYELSRRSSTDSGLNAQYSWNVLGARALLIGLGQGYSYRFSRNAVGSANAGVAYTRGTSPEGTTDDGLGAQLGASYSVTRPFEGGVLTASFSAGYAPAIDPSTTEINPHLGIGAGLSWWNRDRLTLSATSSATLSAEPDEGGAVQNVAADLGMTYVLGAGFTFAAGVRGAWATFEQVEILPPTAAIYAALTWGADLL